MDLPGNNGNNATKRVVSGDPEGSLRRDNASASSVQDAINSNINTHSNNDDTDDDDDADDASTVLSLSSCSFSSSCSSSSSNTPSAMAMAIAPSRYGVSSSLSSLTLRERQARNIARNELFLGSLRKKYRDKMDTTPSSNEKETGTSKRNSNRSNNDSNNDGIDTDNYNYNSGTKQKKDRKVAQGDVSDTNMDNNDDDYDYDECIGMTMKGTHRLFRSSFGDAAVAANTAAASTKSTIMDRRNSINSTSVRSYARGICKLLERYPHREVQIERLAALLSATVSLTATIGNRLTRISPRTTRSSSASSKMASSLSSSLLSSSSQVYIPAPIFCTGSVGTGKTSIVCDVIEWLSREHQSQSQLQATTKESARNANAKTRRAANTTKQQHNTINSNSKTNRAVVVRLQPAYVDCSIVEPSTIDRLVYTIYRQLKLSATTSAEAAATSSLSRPRNITDSTTSRRRSKKQQRKKTQKRKRNIGLLQEEEQQSTTATSKTTASISNTTTNNKSNSNSNSNSNTASERDAKEQRQKQQSSSEVTANLRTRPAFDCRSKNESDKQPRDNNNDLNKPRILPSRRAKKAAIHKSMAKKATTYEDFRKHGDDANRSDNDDDGENTVETMHSAILSLGRSLQAYYGAYCDDSGNVLNPNRRYNKEKHYAGVLVLDKAEELLSLSAAGKKGTSAEGGATSVLSELLLLPKIMKLNLTIVVVTNYANLSTTRLNNAVAASGSLSTLSSGVHPVTIQFPAYRGNHVLREILSTEENQQLVMGDSLPTSQPTSLLSCSPPASTATTMRPSLKEKLVRSFWNTIIQFASDSTRDVRDFQRIGRALWPKFAAPIGHPSALRSILTEVAQTLGIATLTKRVLQDPKEYATIEEELVRLLGIRFYPQIAALASGDDSLTLLALDENGILDHHYRHNNQAAATITTTEQLPQQPYLRNCLLLAAFVCQHNKADQDRKLFSIHGNGQRSKAKAKNDVYGGNDEDLAFGSTATKSTSSARSLQQVEQLRSLRLRPIPLERVFSIFVTLVRLNPNGGHDDDDYDFDDREGDLEANMDDLGSSRLYRDLSHLMELGYIQQATFNKGSHQILCSLTREEALGIAKCIGIPLERYLI